LIQPGYGPESPYPGFFFGPVGTTFRIGTAVWMGIGSFPPKRTGLSWTDFRQCYNRTYRILSSLQTP
jgi:hypothetical protein